MGVHVILHFSKPIEQKTPRAASNVNYELDVITNLQGNVSSLAVTNVPLWWEIWMVRRLELREGGGGTWEISCSFPSALLWPKTALNIAYK